MRGHKFREAFSMTSHFRKYLRSFSITAAAAMLLTPIAAKQ